MNTKWIQTTSNKNSAKINTILNDFGKLLGAFWQQMIPMSTPKAQNCGLGGVLGALWHALGALGGQGHQKRGQWTPQGSQNGGKIEPKRSQNRTKTRVKKRCESNGDFVPFRTTFWSILGAFLGPKVVRNRPRTDFPTKRVILSKH